MPTQPEIVGEPVEEPPEDGTRVFRYRVKHGDVVDDVQVAIPKALVPEPQNFLPAWVIGPKGRAAVERALAKGRIPKRITLGYGKHEFGEDMPGTMHS
jgi:hypothetical protein